MSAEIMDTIPAEIYLKIWSYLPAKQIMKLRQVCVRWKNIIDELSHCEFFWKNRCKLDYKDIHLSAGEKRRVGLSWLDLYRSLALWPKVAVANDSTYELCNATLVKDEIKSLELLRDGVIGVHTRSSVTYYDIDTLTQVRARISGDFLKYSENEKVSVVLSYHMFMYVHKKLGPLQSPVKSTFEDVKTFLLRDDVLFFIDMNNDLYQCKLDTPEIEKEFVVHSNCGIVSVGFYHNFLHILSLDQGVYAIIDKRPTLVTTLGSTSNLLHLLYLFNFIDMLDWRIFFHWNFVLKHCMPRGPLEEILTMRIYGDIVFVGCNWGIMRIYYKPFVRGQFDIFNAEPIKQYNFMEWFGNNTHCMCPVQSIDVQEAKDGHHVYLAIPRKIIVIKFSHDFLQTYSSNVYIASTTRFGIKRMRLSGLMEAY